MKQYKIECCEKTMDNVAEKVFMLAGSLRGPFVVQLDTTTACNIFEEWLEECGISHRETKYEEQVLKRPDLVAHHLRLATFGRINVGNC